jgi:DNA-binding protein HU-beta
MTRQELIKELSAKVGLSRKDCDAVVTAMLDEIEKTLIRGGKYTQTGFGSFSTVDCKERVGRNPFTKQKMLYPKKRKMKFKPSSVFKGELNEE